DVAILDVGGICGGAADEYIVQDLIAALNLRWSTARFRPKFRDQRRALFDEVVILQRQIFVAPLRGGNRVGVLEIFEGIETLNGKRLCANAGNLFVNVNIEPLDKRHDGDKGGHTDNHAEQRQGRPQLVRPNGRNGNLENF